MLQINQKNHTLMVSYKDSLIFEHSPEKPFIKAMILDLKIKSSHGNFTIKHKNKSIINLDKFIIKDNNNIVFTNGDIEVYIIPKEVKSGIKFEIKTNNDKYSYQFNIKGYEDEGIFGGGEQYRQLNQKGLVVKNFVSEHIVVPPIVRKVLANLFHTKYKECTAQKIDTYAPMSTFVSSKLYCLRFDVDSFGLQDFTDKKTLKFLYKTAPNSILFIKENSYKDIAKALNYDIQNNEYLPDWAYNGIILGAQGGIEKVTNIAKNLIDKGAKINGLWCQDWSGKKITSAGSQVYWNWEVDNTTYPNIKENIKNLKKLGVHFLAYINPYLIVDSKMYNYCKEKGYLIRNQNDEIYQIKSTTFSAGMMDLTNPKMVEYLKNTIIKKNMLDLGIEGYMADFGEYLPTDCKLYNGDSTVLHNKWPTIWAKINREAISEHENRENIFFFTRSGYNNCQQYTTMMWNGDQHTDFTKDYGMPCTIPATFNIGFSGVSATHSDIGGFISFASIKRNEELLIRWLEMNTFSILMRGHETIRPEINTQMNWENIIPYTVKFSNIHKKIKPYFIDCMKQANLGIPIIRPDFYESNDYTNHKDEYSYFVGSDLFVAPVIEKGVTTRKVFLPEGKWVHLFTKKEYESGEFLIDTPLGKPAVFYRKDSKYNSLFSEI